MRPQQQAVASSSSQQPTAAAAAANRATQSLQLARPNKKAFPFIHGLLLAMVGEMHSQLTGNSRASNAHLTRISRVSFGANFFK
jgi:hypothetical protein